MTVHFLHLSDTHLGADPAFEIASGIRPQERTRALVDAILHWIEHRSLQVDFVVHTGDLVHRGHTIEDDGESTRLGVALLRQIPRPIHFVVGNHDHRRALRGCLVNEPGEVIPGMNDRWAYHFERAGERFVVLDARGALAIDPRGSLCDAQLRFVEGLIRTSQEPLTFFVHYPPLALECDWIDRTMGIVNGEELHRLLRPVAARVRGVFFGHVHRPVAAMRDGVLYSSVGSACMHFPNWPNASAATMEFDPIAFVNYVRIDSHGVLIKNQWAMPTSPLGASMRKSEGN
jgi:3',5'-cyclic AMP phosphodiesterase CpdA